MSFTEQRSYVGGDQMLKKIALLVGVGVMVDPKKGSGVFVARSRMASLLGHVPNRDSRPTYSDAFLPYVRPRQCVCVTPRAFKKALPSIPNTITAPITYVNDQHRPTLSTG